MLLPHSKLQTEINLKKHNLQLQLLSEVDARSDKDQRVQMAIIDKFLREIQRSADKFTNNGFILKI